MLFAYGGFRLRVLRKNGGTMMENESTAAILKIEEISDIVMLDSRRYDNGFRGE